MSDQKSWQLTPSVLLGIVFVTLKLCGVIHWSWWWVTCPFWVGPPVCAVAILVQLIVVAGQRKAS